ncbi:MAG TPA: FAD-binding oxidoreductase [Solirubrobacter sp.]|nr:FAD-binding oxidoreductase [Solirubrobacter sp.]
MLHDSETLLAALAAAVGDAHVLVDADLRAPFETDWTGRFSGTALAVVRPADTEQVAAVLRACAAHGAAVVPQGGNTGLVGGGVPRGGEVVLSLTRLNEVGPVDRGAAQVTAGAGATLAAVQAAASDAGLDFPLDFAARDSATVGGLIATNAGGLRAVSQGTMRARVVGLEVVLSDGAVVDRTAALLKDNAGLDLGALVIGSEGILGVVTRARLRLAPSLPARVAALVGVDGPAAAVELLAALRAHAPALDAVDFMLEDALALALAHLDVPSPLPEPSPLYVLVECAAFADPLEQLADALEAAGAAERAVVAEDRADRARLWRIREALPDAINAAGIPHKLDVGVPLDRLAAFLDAVPGAAPGARMVLFGHLGDGNVHVNVLGAGDGTDEAVLRLVAASGGTISAEHGVGVAKARWLDLVRAPADIAAMRALKAALDPGGRMNPGAVLP